MHSPHNPSHFVSQRIPGVLNCATLYDQNGLAERKRVLEVDGFPALSILASALKLRAHHHVHRNGRAPAVLCREWNTSLLPRLFTPEESTRHSTCLRQRLGRDDRQRSNQDLRLLWT